MTRKISLYAVITALTVAVSMVFIIPSQQQMALLHWRMQGFTLLVYFWSDWWLDSRSFKRWFN